MPKASTVPVHDSFTEAMGRELNWGKNTKALFDPDRTPGLRRDAARYMVAERHIGGHIATVYAILGLSYLLGLAVPAQAQSDPPRVIVALYLLDLLEITGSDQSFLADVFMVARWNDSTLAGDYSDVRSFDPDDVWHPTLVVINERAAARTLPEIVHVDPDGNVQYSVRLTGRFSATMNLKNFPLDRQEFSVWVAAPPLGGKRVDLVPDTSMRVLLNERPSISDWTVAEPTLVAKEFRATPLSAPFQGVALVIQARRNRGYYVIQVLLPLIAIVLMAWTVFWIDPSVVATRIGVVVSTMLTLIAYRFMLGNLVPKLSYLTRLDYFMLGATSVIILTLFVMAAASYLRTCGKAELVERIDAVGRVAFPVVFGAITALVWLT
jgi:hypothetical protein